jgi:quinol monooxygenase YgiN
MHILIISFRLDGMSAEAFHELCHELAPTWAQIPGLLSKVWLEDSETNTYGGVYTWSSREAMNEFLQSELFDAIASNPNFIDATVKDYGVIEAPTRVTRGLVAIPA